MNSEETKTLIEQTNEKHNVYHRFCAWAEKQFGENWNDPKILSGHEVMEKVEEYAKDNPEISIAYCDDNLFASSLLVVIPHKDMGNTILFIPQLTFETNQFFLYPNHQKSFIKALNDNTHETLLERFSKNK